MWDDNSIPPGSFFSRCMRYFDERSANAPPRPVLPYGSRRLAAAEPAARKDAAEPVSFYRQVRPILVQNCQGCHQPAKPQGGFVMTSYADLLKPGEHDMPGIVPGKPDQSYIIEQIQPDGDGKTAMPRNKDPLCAKDIELIRRWIAEGATNDTPATAADVVDAEHPPVYTLPPVITSIDYSPDSIAPRRVGISRGAVAPGGRQRARRPAGGAVGAHQSPSRFRPTANSSPWPAARRRASARCRSGTSKRRSCVWRSR